MFNKMTMTKDGQLYRLTQIGLEFYIEDEDTRKCVDSRYCGDGWTYKGRAELKQWVESLGYTVTRMKAI